MKFAWTAAIVLAACPAMALQPLEVFLAAARERNPDAQEARANVAQQEARADLSLGRQLPGISVGGSYDRNQHGVDLSLAGRSLVIQPVNVWSAVASLDVPLIDLASFRRIQASKTSAESSSRALEATRLGVEGQTAQDYYQLLADIALVSAAEKYLEVSRENLRITQAKLRAGAATRLEVDRALADVEQQVQQLAAAKLQVSLGERHLQSTTSVRPDLSSPVELTDDLRPEPDLAVFEGHLSGVPSVLAAASATRAAEQQADAEKLALLPAIAGRFTETTTTAPGFEPSRWYWQAGLTAT
jgi:outer membrane protein TolC